MKRNVSTCNSFGDKLFFMYFAPGAVHAPYHVPKNISKNTKEHSMRAGM